MIRGFARSCLTCITSYLEIATHELSPYADEGGKGLDAESDEIVCHLRLVRLDLDVIETPFRVVQGFQDGRLLLVTGRAPWSAKVENQGDVLDGRQGDDWVEFRSVPRLRVDSVSRRRRIEE